MGDPASAGTDRGPVRLTRESNVRNPTAAVQRCTAMRRSGEFCDAPTLADMPFPICPKHAAQVYDRMVEHLGDKARTAAQMLAEQMRRMRSEPTPEHDEQLARRQAALAAQSQVYYVRIGEHVKIGVTTNMRARMNQLRVELADVLATEPGDQRTERNRHVEFAAERVGRREDFNPSPRLLAHIDRLREEHGEPNITTWPQVA